MGMYDDFKTKSAAELERKKGEEQSRHTTKLSDIETKFAGKEQPQDIAAKRAMIDVEKVHHEQEMELINLASVDMLEQELRMHRQRLHRLKMVMAGRTPTVVDDRSPDAASAFASQLRALEE